MTAAPDIAALIAEADTAQRQGRDASALWQRIEAQAPHHPRVLFLRGQQEMERRRPAEAVSFFARAGLANPHEAAIAFHEALAHRALGDAPRELAALDRALSINPDYFLALLGKGVLLERQGRMRAAARLYKRVLEIAPDDKQMPPALREALAHAREVVAQDIVALEAWLKSETGGWESASERMAECLEILSGTKRPYVQSGEMMLFPQLPAIPFYDRALFPWIGALEAATADIRREVTGLLKDDSAGFGPYVDLPVSEPLQQWADLNQSPQWNAYYLWKNGARIGDHCARASRTAAVLENIPLLEIAGFAPTAFFSVLAPRMHLPAHTGSTNIRLTVHLPLILPGPARFRVGNTMRDWREGEAWVLDDTIEHEAWNDAEAARTILIFDVWNPLLTPEERKLSAALLNAHRRYYRQA